MKYYLIAGERSGDMHGAALMHALAEADSSARFRGIGGEAMREAGLACFYESERLGIVGISEVLGHILDILRLLKRTKVDILRYKPDIMIFIDFAGFNLSLASFTRRHGIFNAYYVSPKVWAWKSYRVHRIKRTIDCMLCILPLEPAFYEKYGYKSAVYVGNPLVRALAEYRHSGSGADKPVVGLLPGSRIQEVKRILPLYAKLSAARPDYRFRVAALSSIPSDMYALVQELPNVELTIDDTYVLLASADAAIVASGTASLETAIIGTPQLVCYRLMPLSYWIIRTLLKVRAVSLVNLILERNLVEELLQHDFTVPKTLQALDKLLKDKALRTEMQLGYVKLREKLGNIDTPAKAARYILTQYKRRS